MTKKLFYFVFFVFLFFSAKSEVYGAYYCNPPPDYCIGQVANSVQSGCQRTGPTSCGPTYRTDYFSCNSDCLVDYPFAPTYACNYDSASNSCVPGIIVDTRISNSNCCVNSGPPAGPSCGNGTCDSGESCINCPGDCGACPNPSVCGTVCATGRHDSGSIVEIWRDESVCTDNGFSCAPWQGTVGDCDTDGENCTRICWNAVCGGAPLAPVGVGGFVRNSVTNAGIQGVPITVQKHSGESTTFVTDSTGRYGGSILEREQMYNVVSTWYLNGTPLSYIATLGFLDYPRHSRNCTTAAPCRNMATGSNVPYGSYRIDNQRAMYAPSRCPINLEYGFGLDAIRSTTSGDDNCDHVMSAPAVGAPRGDFYMTPRTNWPPVARLNGRTDAYPQLNITHRINITDSNNNFNRTRVHMRKATDDLSAWVGDWIAVPLRYNTGVPVYIHYHNQAPCNTGGCNDLTFTFNIYDACNSAANCNVASPPGGSLSGKWVVAVNAFDSVGALPYGNLNSGACTGNPGVANPTSNDLSTAQQWFRCNEGSTPDGSARPISSRLDSLVVTVTTPPPTGTLSRTDATPVEVGRNIPLRVNASSGSATQNVSRVEVWKCVLSGASCAVGTSRMLGSVVYPALPVTQNRVFNTNWDVRDGEVGNNFFWIVVSNNQSSNNICSGFTGYVPACDMFNADRLTLNLGTVVLSGTVWNSTGLSCSDPFDPGRFVDDSFTIRSSYPVGSVYPMQSSTNPSGNSSGSYSLTVPNGQTIQQLCFTSGPSSPGGDFTWQLANASYPPTQCTLISGGTCFTPSMAGGTAWRVTQTDPASQIINIGFGLDGPAGWVTAQNGDVYSEGGISMSIPNTLSGGWAGYLLNNGYVHGGGSSPISVVRNGLSRIVQTGGYVQRLGTPMYFPQNMSFVVPPVVTPNIVEISDVSSALWGDLNPNNVYVVSPSVLNARLNQGTLVYNVSGSSDAVVVVFVPSGEPVFFSNNVTSADSNQRAVFIVNDSVDISADLGISTPNTVAAPQIEAAIIASGNITFESNYDAGDPLGTADLSVVVEGPLVSRGQINLLRDRFISNSYPAEIVRYRSLYLIELAKKIRSDTIGLYSGISEQNITWEYVD